MLCAGNIVCMMQVNVILKVYTSIHTHSRGQIKDAGSTRCDYFWFLSQVDCQVVLQVMLLSPNKLVQVAGNFGLLCGSSLFCPVFYLVPGVIVYVLRVINIVEFTNSIDQLTVLCKATLG